MAAEKIRMQRLLLLAEADSKERDSGEIETDDEAVQPVQSQGSSTREGLTDIAVRSELQEPEIGNGNPNSRARPLERCRNILGTNQQDFETTKGSF